jgi:parallel beta-helix repeat protein
MKSIIKNIWIKNACTENTISQCAIYCNSATVTTFERIKVAGFLTGSGIIIDNMHSSKIIECDITNCKYAIYLSGGSNNVIEKNRIDENEYGIFQNSSTNIDIDNNLYTFTGTFINLTINRNRFENNSKCSIYLIAFGTGYLENSNITISENYFTSLATDNGAMIFGRCNGINIESNCFKGDAYNSEDENKYNQNIKLMAPTSDISLKDNVAVQWVNDSSTIKSNPYISADLCSQLGLLNDIEINQSSRKSFAIDYKRYNIFSGSGAIDSSKGEIFVLADGSEISAITLENMDVYTSKEITLIADGVVTIKNTSEIKLKDGIDFSMNLYNSITLVRAWVSNGIRWIEKSRTVI